MEILQQVWGSTPEGEAIVLYTIRNSKGCEVQLCNIGASIVSVKGISSGFSGIRPGECWP